MNFLRKETLIEIPYSFVYVDRICPYCSSPVGLKTTPDGKLKVEVCTNENCPYWRLVKNKD